MSLENPGRGPLTSSETDEAFTRALLESDLDQSRAPDADIIRKIVREGYSPVMPPARLDTPINLHANSQTEFGYSGEID